MSDPSTALVSAIHGAAREPERWPEVSRRLTGAFDAAVGIFAIMTAPDGIPDVRRFALHGMSTSTFQEWAARVPWLGPSMRFPERVVARIDRLIPPEEMPREFVEQIIRPHSMERGLGVAVLNRPGTFAAYSVYRTEPFDAEEERRFLDLAGSFEQATYYDEHLRGSIELLYRSGGALVLLAADGTVVFTNAAAERLLRVSTVLQVRHLKLRATSHIDQRTLGALLHRAQHEGAAHCSAALGQDGIVGVTAVPIHGALQIPGAPSRAVVALHLSDPEVRTHEAVHFIQDSYRLTSAEAHVVEAVLRGHGLPEASATLGIAPTTARTHLQHIFQKTGTRHQAELVRLAFGASPSL